MILLAGKAETRFPLSRNAEQWPGIGLAIKRKGRGGSWGRDEHHAIRQLSEGKSFFKKIRQVCCCLVAKLCLTLLDSVDCWLPGSSVHGILARILEWVAISFSRGSSQARDGTHTSCMAGGFFTTEPPGKHRMERMDNRKRPTYGASIIKNLPANAGGVGLIPISRRSPWEGNGNPLQYSCLRNPMDRGAW